ncbi:EF-hand domain-containing protein [Pseudoscourfieldia marina]
MASLEERLLRYRRTQDDLRASIASRVAKSRSSSLNNTTTLNSSVEGALSAGSSASEATPAGVGVGLGTVMNSDSQQLVSPTTTQDGGETSQRNKAAQKQKKGNSSSGTTSSKGTRKQEPPERARKINAAYTPNEASTKQTPPPPTSSTPAASEHDERVKLLELTVDVGVGRSDVIHVYEGDEPQSLAQAFVERNALSPKVAGPLARHISSQLVSVAELPLVPPPAPIPKPPANSTKRTPGGQQEQTPAYAGRQASTSPRTHTQPIMAHTEMPRTRPMASARFGAHHLHGRPVAKTTGAVPAGANGRRRLGKKSKAAIASGERLYGDYESRERKIAARREELARKVEAEVVNTRVPMSAVSRKLSRGRNTGGFDTFHDRLYAEGLESARRREEVHRKVQEQRAEQEAATFVGSPAISELAKTMKRTSVALGESTFERLTRDNGRNAREARLEAMRREKEEREMEECSFAPSINTRSRALAQSLRLEAEHETLSMYRASLEAEGWSAVAAAAGVAPLHEQLYEEAEDRRRRRQAYEAWRPDGHTFQPSITESSRAIAESLRGVGGEMVAPRASGPGVRNDANIFDRLYAEKDAIALRKSELHADIAAPFDEKTGQPLYQPMVGRNPQFERNSARLDIGDFLYAMRYEFDDKKQYATEHELQKIDEQSNMSHMTWKSYVVVEKLKQRRFDQLYRYLARGRLDGLVDLSNTQLFVRLDPEVRNDLYEMRLRVLKNPSDVEGCTLAGDGHDQMVLVNKSAFMRLINDLVDMGPLAGPRHYLLPSAGRKIDPQEGQKDSFAPKISEHSRKLAAGRRPEGMPIEDLMLMEEEQAAQRREELRRQREQDALLDCTFQPQLFSTSNTRRGVMSKVAMMRKPKPPPSAMSPLEQLRDAVLSGDAQRTLSGKGNRGEVGQSLDVMEDAVSRWHEAQNVKTMEDVVSRWGEAQDVKRIEKAVTRWRGDEDEDDDSDGGRGGVYGKPQVQRMTPPSQAESRRRDRDSNVKGANLTSSVIRQAMSFLEDVSSSSDDD